MPTERSRLTFVGLLCAAWLAQLVSAWPALLARVPTSSLVALISIHGGAVWTALDLYRQSRRQPTMITSRDLTLVFSTWLAAWLIDLSILSRLTR